MCTELRRLYEEELISLHCDSDTVTVSLQSFFIVAQYKVLFRTPCIQGTSLMRTAPIVWAMYTECAKTIRGLNFRNFCGPGSHL